MEKALGRIRDGFGMGLERVWDFEILEMQVFGAWRRQKPSFHWFWKLNFQAVIKSAASAASPKTKIQESRGASGQRLGMRTAGTARLPCIPGFCFRGGYASSQLDHGSKIPSGEAALAAVFSSLAEGLP